MDAGQPKCRPRYHLEVFGKRFPAIWKEIDLARAGRGNPAAWPDWCFMPLGCLDSIVGRYAGVRVAKYRWVQDSNRLGALAAWRVTQGIYRFDPTVYEELVASPIGGQFPCDPLYRLPEWCVYIETPGMDWLGESLYGVWAHLDFQLDNGAHKLQLVFDTESELALLPISLGRWSLVEAIDRVLSEVEEDARRTGDLWWINEVARDRATLELPRRVSEAVTPIMSLLLYLCTQSDRWGDEKILPGRPPPKRTKQGLRMFPPDKPVTWDVGVRLGAALREGKKSAGGGAGGSGGRQSPRGHVRRFHWHGYWLGPKKASDGSPIPDSQRTFDVRWTPPIPVNLGRVDDLPATIRPVLRANEQ